MSNELEINWQARGPVAPGGAVLQVAGDGQNNLWLASPAGLFRRTGNQSDKRWQAIWRGIPFWQVTALAAERDTIWLAGLPGAIIRSLDGGRSWTQCWIEQTQAPVVVLAVSPNYRRDGVLLAGTDGDGILRSTDGGRRWQLSNFGLREFAVIDLATAPVWGRHEFAFALIEEGVYQSPNGGRAWRRVPLANDSVRPLSLAVSPNFAADQTVIVGAEDGRLFHSSDAGRSWQCLSEGLGPINALAYTGQGALLIGTPEGIYRLDAGAIGAPAGEIGEIYRLATPVLSLSVVPGALYAGLIDGLYESSDDGRTWQPAVGLSARRFIWYLTTTSDRWLAAGPEEGVWLSTDGGREWRAIWEETPVLAMADKAEQIVVSTVDGVAASADAGLSWQRVFTPEEPITALAVAGQVVWAGTATGQLWQGRHGKWHKVNAPTAGHQLLGLFSHNEALIAAVWQEDERTMELWRSDNSGETWSLWFRQPASPMMPQVAFADDAGMEAIIGLGTYIYRRSNSAWQRERLTGADAPVTALLTLPNSVLAALTDCLVATVDGCAWAAVEEFKGEAVVALRRVIDDAGRQRLLAGTADGYVWVGHM